MTFIVIKPFTYAGKDFARGDTWEPGGYRNDRAMINSRMVVLIQKQKRGTRGKPVEPGPEGGGDHST